LNGTDAGRHSLTDYRPSHLQTRF